MEQENSYPQQEKSLWQYFVDTIKVNYFNFKGRARRREYWGFVLFYTIFSIIINMLFEFTANSHSPRLATIIMAISFIYSLFLLIPSISITVRRFHDYGKSGWWYLLFSAVTGVLGGHYFYSSLVAKKMLPILWLSVILILIVLCLIITLIWLVSDGQPYTNKWGPDPKHREQERPL